MTIIAFKNIFNNLLCSMFQIMLEIIFYFLCLGWLFLLARAFASLILLLHRVLMNYLKPMPFSILFNDDAENKTEQFFFFFFLNERFKNNYTNISLITNSF